MVPASILSSTEAARRRLSFYISVNLASVLAPGIVTVVSVIVLVESSRQPSSPLLFLDHFKNYNGPLVLLLALVVIAAGYVFGYISRELSFKLLGQLEKRPKIHARILGNIYPRLHSYFEQSLIDDCLQAHRLIGVTAEGEMKPSDLKVPAGGGHSETLHYRDFIYAKLWIRNYAAGFSVDSIEAEINILASGLMPTLLSAIDIVIVAREAWPAIIAALAFLGLTWSVILDSLIRLRHTERWEALRNLVMDYAMREALGRVPQAQGVSDGQLE